MELVVGTGAEAHGVEEPVQFLPVAFAGDGLEVGEVVSAREVGVKGGGLDDGTDAV